MTISLSTAQTDSNSLLLKDSESYLAGLIPEYQKTIKSVRKLREKEEGFLSAAHQNRLEALYIAFDIGEIIENEVIAAYGESKMTEFSNLCGFQFKTAYNYLNLYRAAGFKALLTEHKDLPRTYWYAIGSKIKWDEDMMGDMLRRSLLQFPIWKDANTDDLSVSANADDNNNPVADMDKVKQVGKALNDIRNTLKEQNIYYAFRDYELHIGKPPQGQKAYEKWLNDYDDHLFFTQKPENQHEDIATFVTERMPLENDEYADICYLLELKNGDQKKYEEALETIAKFQIAVSAITGWTHFKLNIGEKSEAFHEEFKVETRFVKGGYEAIKYAMVKKQKLKEIRQQSPNIEMQQEQDNLMHGDCLTVLKSNAFSKRSIDVCLTDSPYGEEVYCEWREHTKVYHDEPKSTKEAAELLGSVAQVLVNREIIKDQFIWFSFVPIDWVHVFLPPVLDAFKGLNIKHQVLVWDKDMLGKAGGYRTFARQAEAILYVNVGNRALFPITLEENKKPTNMHSSVLKYKAESKAGENEFWKPLGVLEHLIRIATGETIDEDSNSQLILDPFCGSGSTGVAAINCNRDFRLIESHEGQFKKAKDNILEAAGEKTAS